LQIPKPLTSLSPLAEQLRASDKELLFNYYRATTNLAEKCSLNWTLGLIQDEATVKLFMGTLTNDYRGKVLPDREETFLLSTLEVLGLLAARSDSAYEFLKRATEPQFWKPIGLSRESGSLDDVLASKSFAALGLSGRADAAGVFEQARLNHTKLPFECYGGLREGAFYLHLTRAHTRPEVDSVLRTLESRLEAFQAWRANTEEGRKWKAWFDEVAGLNKLEEPK